MDRIDVSALSFDDFVGREWLSANGIGGFASSTVCGMNTRKYHGLLVAAMSPPVRRMAILARVDEFARVGGEFFAISCNEYPGAIFPRGYQHLRAFCPEPFPRWAYQTDAFTLEKSLRLIPGQNTVLLAYTLLAGDKPIELELRPQMALRGIHELMYQWNAPLAAESIGEGRLRLPPTARTPEAFLAHDGGFRPEPAWYLNTLYRREQERGYAGLEDLWMPGAFRWTLEPGESAHFACSTDPIQLDRTIEAAVRMATPVQIDLAPVELLVTGDDLELSDLAKAASAFVIDIPAPPYASVKTARNGEAASKLSTVASPLANALTNTATHADIATPALASSPAPAPLDADEYANVAPSHWPGADAPAEPSHWPALRDAAAAPTWPAPFHPIPSSRFPALVDAVSVMNEYPWSSPSGREMLIAFSGLFLVTGRFEQGRRLLEGMATRLDAGLLPSEYPESGADPVYAGADVSLWFANAAYNYVRYTGDVAAAQMFCGLLRNIVQHYRQGTRLGIQCDADGLLATHQPGAATTWMNAKTNGWVVTPRQGRPVEVNALWYNALRATAELCSQTGLMNQATDLALFAARVKNAFNAKFWNVGRGCCYDVLGDAHADEAPDASVRPNQLLALSLPFPVLSSERHEQVLWTVNMELLTPWGVRTLSPRDHAYQPHCRGDIVARDRALHQGSAYPWLLGAFVTAYLRFNGRSAASLRAARGFIEPCIQFLRGDGLGCLPAFFDGDAPHHPAGGYASAVGVAEILRCHSEDILGRSPSCDIAAKPPIKTAAELAAEFPGR